jgi:hypothetical protein
MVGLPEPRHRPKALCARQSQRGKHQHVRYAANTMASGQKPNKRWSKITVPASKPDTDKNVKRIDMKDGILGNDTCVVSCTKTPDTLAEAEYQRKVQAPGNAAERRLLYKPPDPKPEHCQGAHEKEQQKGHFAYVHGLNAKMGERPASANISCQQHDDAEAYPVCPTS